MTAKELITILKRFPKDSKVEINSAAATSVEASSNNFGQWSINIKSAPKTQTSTQQAK